MTTTPDTPAGGAVACHRTVAGNGEAWMWVTGMPSLGALDNLKVHPTWRIEYAYYGPSPETPVGIALHEQRGPDCYGIRRKGANAIIGVVPQKVACTQPSSAEYLRDYEEVPLYTLPPATVSADAVLALVAAACKAAKELDQYGAMDSAATLDAAIKPVRNELEAPKEKAK